MGRRNQLRSAERDEIPCTLGEALGLFGGRWKGAIIWWLGERPRRFNEIRRLIPEVTPRALTLALRELERDGLVRRRQYPEIPPRVEYTRTPLCDELVPLLDSVAGWWAEHRAEVSKARKRFGTPSKAGPGSNT